KPSIDFLQTAKRVMREHGFDPEFGPDVLAQAGSAKEPASTAGLRDLRDLLWSSIDNDESRDLDQVEVAEQLPNGAIRILVGIADVDALVTPGSPADLHANEHSTSAHTPGLAAQLRLQWKAASRLKRERQENGALELETIEATPVAKNGRVVDLALTHKTAARDLIEDFMIASNVAIAKWLEERGRSGIRRIVREPERWPRIVELASQYGETLPNEPDSLALSRFLAKRRVADPLRFPDLSLAVVKLMGPGAYALDLPGKDPGGHFG